MNRLNKIALVLVFSIILLSLSGCANTGKQTSGQDNAPITMKYVFGGPGTMKDSQEVWSKFNEKLQEFLPNTNVQFEVISYSDYAEKWKLMAASREVIDLAWVGWMNDLNEEVQKGSLLPLDDLFKETPDLMKELPSYIFDLSRVNGKCYCVPNYQMMTNLPTGIKTHTDLAKKYLDAEKLTQIFSKQAMITKEDFQIIDDYLAKLKENGELRKGVAPSFLTWIMKTAIGGLGQYGSSIAGNAIIDWRDPDIHVYDEISDFPDSIGYYELVSDWYKKGYIRQDIMSLQDITADQGKEDGYVIWTHSVFKGDSERMTQMYGYPIMSIPIFQELYIPSTRPSTNTGIPSTAKDPVRSVKLLELLNTEKGKELYNLLVFGIEGTHYNKVSENKIEWLGQSAPAMSVDNAYGYDAWALGNTFNAYETQYDTEGWNEYIKNDINDKAKMSPLIGFSLDTTPIKLELAQYSAIKKEYEYLNWGSSDNYKEKLAERDKKLKDGGSDKIIIEIRKQIEAWKASK